MRLGAWTAGCIVLATLATAAHARKPPKGPEPAPERVDNAWYAETRPAGDGWLKVPQGDAGDITMARFSGDADAGSDDTWAAAVIVTPTTSATTPAALTSWLQRELRDRLVASGRFEVKAWTAEADASRDGTCVRYRLATLDRQASRSDGSTGPMTLDERGLACEVGVPRPSAVIAKMSWRGEAGAAPPSLGLLADAWLADVVVKGAPAIANP